MAFENLSDKLQGVFKKLRGKGVLTEKDLKEALREVKLALLEADVNLQNDSQCSRDCSISNLLPVTGKMISICL